MQLYFQNDYEYMFKTVMSHDPTFKIASTSESVRFYVKNVMLLRSKRMIIMQLPADVDEI